ncbi:MAG TPA: hypothetical protein VKZ99_02035 [Gammaproteobacteria bacterium]|nr:hypothetical protein [Gammaproteobacteria bacterium]
MTENTDFDDFIEDDLDGEDFEFLEEAADRRRVQPKMRRNRASWRSVEDYMENKRLKNQLTDVFDED